MATAIYWLVIVATSIIVLHKTHIAAEHNVAGEQKVNGRWIQTMYPDHYTFFGIYLSYWSGALIAIIALYMASAFLLDLSGYSDKWGIQTGMRTLMSCLAK